MRIETKTIPKQVKIYNQTMRALAKMTSHFRSITGFETEPQNDNSSYIQPQALCDGAMRFGYKIHNVHKHCIYITLTL